MTTKHLARCALALLFLAAPGVAAQMVVAPAAKPPSFWSRVFGRTTSPAAHVPAEPTLPQRKAPPERAAPRELRDESADSRGAVRATWNEPLRSVAAPTHASRPAPRFGAWWNSKRGPSRTVSEFMARERP